MDRVLILIDEPIEFDMRVQKTIDKYHNPIIIDCRNNNISSVHPFYLILSNLPILIISIVYSPIFWFNFYRKYKYKPDGFIGGIMTSLRMKHGIDNTVKILKNNYSDVTFDLIYANDLRCALIAIKLSKTDNCHLIYDAHELAFHRNRKNSCLRISFEVLLEKSVFSKKIDLIVVNKPAVNIYTNFFNIQENKIKIIDNNHFELYQNYALNKFKEFNKIGILYIGSATNGRKLEDLHTKSVKYRVLLHGFFLSNLPSFTSEYNWNIGTKNYLPELLKLIGTKKLLMWCCTEDVCLSYRLSLPNKFFQAIAVGIPIIAYKETYLADIVQRYKIGYIYNDDNFEEILRALNNTDEYYELLKSVSLFQKKLFIDKLEL